MRARRVVLVLGLLAGSSPLAAQPAPTPEQEPVKPVEPVEPVAPTPTPEPAQLPRIDQERLEKLEEENEELRERLELLEEDTQYVDGRVQKLAAVSAKLTGFLDVGFFSVRGDGLGIRPDTGHRVFPEYDQGNSGVPASWVFMGDPLSTMINSRGEAANTGDSRAITFDALEARKSTFLVNTVNVGLFAEVGKNAVFTSKIDLLPRGRDVAKPDGLFLGDYLDVRLAYLEYRIQKGSAKIDLFAGKFDSVVGFEYRAQEAPSRIEVTPSLICRYTCGYPIGVKARFRFFDDALVLNTAVTNGSQFSEGFAFYNEIDTNQFKTVSGRLSLQLPFARELELGVSGSFGAQDHQVREDVYQWLYNIDLHFHRHDFVFRAEFLQGNVKGESDPAQVVKCGISPCLRFKGAYGLAGYRLTNIVMPYVRVDWRDALHRSGASFIYISEVLRATGGLRMTLNENLIFKVEYTVNQELGRIPDMPNDVFTSSLVAKY